MIAAVVLAAGASRRLGQPKQLVELAGEALLRRAVRMALEAGCRPVVAVVPPEHARLDAVLEGLEVQRCVNPDAAEGMGASIRVGVGALPDPVEAVLLLTVDQVAVDPGLLGRLLTAYRSGTGTLACAYEGQVGIPAIFPRSAFPDLRRCRGDRGARDLLKGARALAFPRGGEDLDTPEDLARLRR